MTSNEQMVRVVMRPDGTIVGKAYHDLTHCYVLDHPNQGVKRGRKGNYIGQITLIEARQRGMHLDKQGCGGS